jgi:hypothetical protein
MTPEQIIRGMLDRQRKLLKLRSKRKPTPYEDRDGGGSMVPKLGSI